MAVIKGASAQTLFDLAQAQMFDTVKRRVKADLIADFVNELRAHLDSELDMYMAEYAALEVIHVADMAAFQDQFVIYLTNDKKDKGVEIYKSKDAFS